MRGVYLLVLPMGANANLSGNQDGSHGGPTSSQGGGGGGGAAVANPSSGSVAAAGGNLGTGQALKHNPGLSMEWSAEEQTILEEGLNKSVFLILIYLWSFYFYEDFFFFPCFGYNLGFSVLLSTMWILVWIAELSLCFESFE